MITLPSPYEPPSSASRFLSRCGGLLFTLRGCGGERFESGSLVGTQNGQVERERPRIPVMLIAWRSACAQRLPFPVGHFHDRSSSLEKAMRLPYGRGRSCDGQMQRGTLLLHSLSAKHPVGGLFNIPKRDGPVQIAVNTSDGHV